MSGFDADRINVAFFAGTSTKVNFVRSLRYGDRYGDASTWHPRLLHLSFNAACKIA
jgi:3-hydroxypropanoate dehydrogenase